MSTRDRHLSESLPGRQTKSRRLGISNVLFKPMTLFALIAIGVFSFAALIVLGGFADDLRKTPPGQATPRSVSAVGYKALIEYMNETGYLAHETRGDRSYYVRENQLVLYTPKRTYTRLSKVMEGAGDEVSLVILPKWSVGQMFPQPGEEGRTDWARKATRSGLQGLGNYDYILEDMPVIRRAPQISQNIDIEFTRGRNRNLPNTSKLDIERLQYFDLEARWPDFEAELRKILIAEREAEQKKQAEERGETYEPPKEKEKSKRELKAEAKAKAEEEKTEAEPLPDHDVLMRINGHPVLIQLEGTETFVLSEPDLLNTMAFNTQTGARLALGVVDEVIVAGDAEFFHVDFDVKLHGIESGRNLVKLMVTPPFLAATLCLLLAGGLIAWQGFNRFGDPTRLRPDYAQGPVSLAETAAEFMEIANRTHRMGGDYAALVRRQVVEELGYKGRTEDATDTLLDGREARRKISPTYTELKTKISAATPQSYGQYAKALATWRTQMTDTILLQEDPKT